MANMNNSKIGSGNEMAKFIKLIIAVAAFFAIFYVLTLFLNKEETKDTVTPATIQYDRILVGNILNQANDVYYVLVEASEDKNTSLYETYVTLYKAITGANRVYYASLDNPINAKFVAEESNTKISNISDLKLKGTTLLKIESGKITQAYEDKDTIKLTLAKMAGIEETK